MTVVDMVFVAGKDAAGGRRGWCFIVYCLPTCYPPSQRVCVLHRVAPRVALALVPPYCCNTPLDAEEDIR